MDWIAVRFIHGIGHTRLFSHLQMKNKHWVIAGPESTGKSSLWQALAPHIPMAEFVPEYNRIWLEENKITPPYTPAVLTAVFQDSLNHYDAIEQNELCIWDTDELNLALWSRHENHPMQGQLMHRFLKNNHQYILCPPDLDWEYDPLRQGPAEMPSGEGILNY
ncbi:MAG: hypothetical protein FJX95_06510 [Bacteroidetes bacterium]|nr:hypothetical protein [Bacteroidota bacterium]